jgi:LmbE family N-acetylglucosaminyl deacetylase
MLSLSVSGVLQSNPRLLLLGAHCDDIEIGCGATLVHLFQAVPELEVEWIVFSSNELREKEARSSAEEFLSGVRKHNIEILQYKNCFFPSESQKIKGYFEELKNRIDPAVIFTHCRGDLHQDHRTINELTWNTFRNHLVLEYEIPKYDGDLGQPDLFFPVSEEALKMKTERLMNHYQSQLNRQWFTTGTFEAITRIRGIECNSETGFAEAFYGRKVSIK